MLGFLSLSIPATALTDDNSVHTDTLQAGYYSAFSSPTKFDTIIYTGKILFPKASAAMNPEFSDNARCQAGIRDFLTGIGADTARHLRISIVGSASPEGYSDFNRLLAHRRATALSTFIGAYTSVTPTLSISTPKSAPVNEYPSLRSAALTAVCLQPSAFLSPETEQPDALSAESHKNTGVSENTGHSEYDDTQEGTGQSQVSGQSEPTGHSQCRWPQLAVGTNMLYDAACVPNISLKAHIAGRFNFGADWMCAWWDKKSRHLYYRIYGGDVDLSFRIGRRGGGSDPFAGHHLGLYASMVCYDLQFGTRHTGLLSDKYNYAAGVSYTYSMPVCRRLNIDFSLGAGYAWGRMKKHTPIDDHDVWKSTHNWSWIGPTRAGISLIYLIGPATYNNPTKKGGRR